MTTRSFSGRLLASTVLGGAVASAMLLATPASAQQSAPADAAPGAQVEELVVTGSLFRRAVDAETASPVTALTSETLTRAGVTDISQAVRSIAADGAGSIASTRSSFSGGATTVSLRNVGAGATLTLIDGLRSVGFPMNDDGHISFVDLNSIPFSAVEQIQVLKDGASSLYGADAIGGVVNIMMKKQFNGYAGQIEAGGTEHGYGKNYRGNFTAGWGDYDAQGWNFYVNGEYQANDRVSNHDVGFPFNNADLTSIGGLDNNRGDDTLSNATTDAKVRRIRQTDLNDPFNANALVAPVPTGNYALLTDPSNCKNGTFAVTTGSAQGIGCKHNITDEYSYILPKQERYSLMTHFAFRVNDNIQAHAMATFTRSIGDYINNPVNVNQVQPFRAPPSMSSNNIVLPVYICSTGVNCSTAADRRLNPNNPFAAAYANDPANGAAKLFYLFGDIPTGVHNINSVYRATAGLDGTFDGGWDWKLDFVGAKDELTNVQRGTLDIAGLKQAINTGAYNFVNPSQNSQAVRDLIAPTYSAKQATSLWSIDASVAKKLMDLQGGPLQLALGAQFRHETQNSPGVNPTLSKFATTAGAKGSHNVEAGFFEVDAPVLESLDITASGRYDNYSEGFHAFSPKLGATFTPFKQVKFRGTWSKGFRAPSFAERDPTSGFSGSFTVVLPQSYIDAHGGSTTADYVAASRSARGGFVGASDLKPEKSRSFTVGTVISPTRDLDFTIDYYDIKKTDVIVIAPLMGQAFTAYYTGQPLPPGYTLLSVGDPDPLYPNALPRATLIGSPYANAASEVSTGVDFSATFRHTFMDEYRLTSSLNGTYVTKYNQTTSDGQFFDFAGTKGPAALSAGAGTPKWRANWQNTIAYKNLSVSATTYFIAKIKNVAADSGKTDLSCANNLYGTGDLFCYIPKFIYTDVNVTYKVNDNVSLYTNIGNISNAKAPLAPGGSNFIGTWHLAGVIGRTFKVGAKFNF